MSTYAEEEPEDALDALGRILRAVIAKTEAAERNKWMEEKATLLEDYNATLKRNVKNLSWCVDVIQKLKAENEKLKGKHRKATALIRAVVEAFCAIGMDVKFVADDGTEVPTTPSKQPNPQSAPPATGEGQCSAESRPEERGRGEVE